MIKFIDSLIAWLTNPGAKAAELAAAIRSAGSLWSSTETQSKLDEKITSIQAGENVTINWLDPQSPIINAQGTGFGDMVGPAGSVADNVPVFSDTSGKRLSDSGVKLSDKANVSALTAKADLDSPEFTGVPKAPTATLGTNTTQLATTAFVGTAIAAIPSGGDVNGPASSVAERIVLFDGTTGKLIKDSTKLISDLQPADADLTAISGLTSAADKMPYATGPDTWAMTDFSAFGRTLVDDADAATARTTLGLVIGTDVQAYDVDTAKVDVDRQWTTTQRGSVTNLAAPSTTSNNVVWDLATNNDFRVVLDVNATVQLPSNMSTRVGQKGRIVFAQDGTGGRTLAAASGIKVLGSASFPAILTAANAETYMAYEVVAAGTLAVSLRGIGG